MSGIDRRLHESVKTTFGFVLNETIKFLTHQAKFQVKQKQRVDERSIG